MQLAAEWSFAPNVVLVPTMGFLHEGHLSLVRAARAWADGGVGDAASGDVRDKGKVLVSIFINPLQFGPGEDFEKYPRDFQRDFDLLEQAGADLVFLPEAADMTPGNMIFKVDPGRMGDVLCGRYRPGHFEGVATIVTKLFQATRPGRAIFGWKDAQQFLLLRKMVRDLNIPVELQALETMRESDGLAMSSRNSYLTPGQRAAAPAIHAALKRVRQQVDAGELNTGKLLGELRRSLSADPLLKLEYAEAVSMDALEPVDTVAPGNTLIAVAVFAGDTRLIDNIRL